MKQLVMILGEVARKGEGDARRAPDADRAVKRLLAVRPLDVLAMQLGLDPPSRNERIGLRRADRIQAAVGRTQPGDLRIVDLSEQVHQDIELVVGQAPERKRRRMLGACGHRLSDHTFDRGPFRTARRCVRLWASDVG